MGMRLGHLRGRFGRRRGWRRRVASVLLLLIVCLVAAFLYLTNPQRLSRFAAGLLRDMTGAEVAIDEARIGWDGRVYLRGLRLRVPGVTGDAGRLFEAEEVTLAHRLGSLFTGRIEARSLVIVGPTLALTQEVSTGVYNYQVLRELRGDGPPGPALEHLPDIFVRQGVVEFAEIEDGRLLPLGRFHVEGRLTQAGPDPGMYTFALRQMTDARPDAQLTGHFSLKDLSVSAELDRFAFDNPYGSVLPRKLRAWWQRLDPAGSLPMFRIAYEPELGLHAIIEVRGMELTLPWGDATDGPDAAPPPRMHDVSGTFALVQDTVRIDALRGQIAGIGYEINGRIDGLDNDAPFRMRVVTDEFEIPDTPGLYTMPRAVEKELRRFDPSGRFLARATVTRLRRGGTIDYEGELILRGVNARYARFAFPLRDTHGVIRFSNRSIDVERLDAKGPNGGTIHVTGAIAPPGEGAAVQLDITCRDLPVDEHVLDNLESKYRSVIDMLGDRAQHARMVESGVIASQAVPSPAQPSPGDAPPPVFDLGGEIDIDIKVRRNLGPVEPYVMNAVLDVAGVNMMFRYWPYPLQLTRGTVHVGPNEVRVENVRATGPHGGFGEMTGVVRKVPGQRERWDPDLTITQARLPLDDLLIATIPQPHEHWLRAFQIRGMIDATGRITAKPDGQITFAIDTTVRDAHANPFGSGFRIDSLTGLARIEPGRVQVSDMTGKRDQSSLTLDGVVDWSATQPVLTLRVRGQDLAFEPALMGLIPPELGNAQGVKRLFDTHQPQGRFDASFEYQTGATAGPGFKLDLAPRTLAFDLRGTRIALTDMTGQVRITADTVTLTDLAAAFEHGRVQASGIINPGPQPGVAITFSAEATQLDATARAAMPAAVVRTIDGLSLDGAYTLTKARYVQRPGVNLEFEGAVRLHGAKADVGVPVTELDGELYVLASQAHGVAWPRLDVRLDAKRLRAADRLVEPLQLHLLTSDHREDLLHIQQLRGVCYGGMLVGEGWIDLAQQGMYRLAMTLSEVQLTPWLDPLGDRVAPPAPDAATASPANPPDDPTQPVAIPPDHATPDPASDRSRGVVTASLTIEGTPGNVASRRGRGALDIRNASLYELPLALAALQIANLTLPQSAAFDRASARFVIDGDTARFDSIRFDAPTVEMAGNGTMQLSTRRLNLRLVSRNPAAPQLGAVSELFNVVKDELINVHVTGTLDDPKARIASFRGTRRTVDRVFGDTPPTPLNPTPNPDPPPP